MLMKEISDHKTYKSAIREWKKGIITTKVWKLLFECKDGTQYWTPLKDIKEYNPSETAEYADANTLLKETAFKWSANKVLKKKDIIIYRFKSLYWRTCHKFCIALPHSVEEAYAINEENGNNFWRGAVEKELKNIRGM